MLLAIYPAVTNSLYSNLSPSLKGLIYFSYYLIQGVIPLCRRYFKQLLVVFLLGGFVSQAFAGPMCSQLFNIFEPATALELFVEAYADVGGAYKPGRCGVNVKEFILSMRAHGMELPEAKVVYLLHERQFSKSGFPIETKLKPARSRGNEPEWHFHVVLKFRDPRTGKIRILDMDTSPQPIDIQKYFDDIFPITENPKRHDSIYLKEFDANAYAQAFADFTERMKYPGSRPRFELPPGPNVTLSNLIKLNSLE